LPSSGDVNVTTADAWLLEHDGFVISAGGTSTLVFVYYSEGATDHGASFGDTDANLIANTTSYFDLNTLGSARLWEDLTTAEKWTLASGGGSGSGEQTPALANTGVDLGSLVLVAFALVGLGGAIVLRCRVTR
jgi:hypothetical protein